MQSKCCQRGGTPETYGETLGTLYTPKSLFENILGAPGHRPGQLLVSLGSLGCPGGHVFRALAPPKQKKVETMCSNASFSHALGKGSRHNLLNVSKTVYIPCIWKGPLLRILNEQCVLELKKIRFWDAFWYPVLPR